MSDFKIFEGKLVKVWLKTKFFYQGIIKSVVESGFMIQDRKLGLMFIADNLVESIAEVNNATNR